MLSSVAIKQQEIIHSTSLQATDYPEFIKYMGSKSKIISAVVSAIDSEYKDGPVCDLFAGSCSLAGAIGGQVPMVSNDIQAYSGVLADTYLNSWLDKARFKTGETYIQRASSIVDKNTDDLNIENDYENIKSLSKFNELERKSQKFIFKEFTYDWHLFAKNYSGTWWSAHQCLWIDALRQVAEEEKGSPFYSVILSSLMFAMAYTSQGTGHYAQYRDAGNLDSMQDILIYRKKSVKDIFLKKYKQICDYLPAAPTELNNNIMATDYRDCLLTLDGGVVYADPPYCFVHYSRFYHAIETLVLYDYPDIQKKGDVHVKGRYRESRHQSPFCIKTKVKNAFAELFRGVNKSRSSLVLSYSNTGMITLDQLIATAKGELGSKYLISMDNISHKHMTMGRRGDRDREVKEALLIARRRG